MRLYPRFLKFLILTTLVLISGLQNSYIYAQQETSNQSLKDQLDAMNRGFVERMDPAVIKNIENAITDVTDTGIMEDVKKVGDRAPDFTLPDAAGEDIQLSSLLKNGPVILTWYRGNW